MHGKPKPEKLAAKSFDPSRANYLGYLADTIASRGVKVEHLVSGDPLSSDYHIWRRAIDREIQPLGLESVSSTMFTGHSRGADALLRYLSAHPSIKPYGLFLVAPWGAFRPQDGSFSKYTIDPGLTDRLPGGVTVLVSKEDQGGVPETVSRINQALPRASIIETEGFGHFVTGNSMLPDYELGSGLYGSQFPELIDILEIL